MLENIGVTRFTNIISGCVRCPVGNDIVTIGLIVDYATVTRKQHPLEPVQKTHHSPLQTRISVLGCLGESNQS